MRIVALVGLVAALVLGAGSFVLGRADATVGEPTAAPALPSALTPAEKAPAKAKPVSAKPVQEQPQPAASPQKKKVKAKPRPVDANGLPMPIATALRDHRSVVVALYLPGAATDELALAEARAGAKDAGAGFVALDALGKQAGPLSEKLEGIADAPALLVFRRPGDIVFRVDGFADRNTVAQAASSPSSRS